MSLADYQNTISHVAEREHRRDYLLTLIGVALLTAACLGIGCSAYTNQMTYSYSPMLVSTTLANGDVRDFDVVLSNEGRTGTGEFRVYVADVLQNAQGNYEIAERGSTRYSCAEWIRLSHDRIRVGPGQSVPISARVVVPRGVYGGRYAAVVLEFVPEVPRDDQAMLSSTFVTRFVTIVELEVTSRLLKRSLSIVGFSVQPAREVHSLAGIYGSDALVITAQVRNDGDSHVFSQGSMILRDSAGRRLRQIPLGGGRGIVLPGASIGLSSVLPSGLPSGQYSASVTVKYGGPRPATTTVGFSVGDADDGEIDIVDEGSVVLPLTVSPSKLELSYPAGATAVSSLVIQNEHSEAVHVIGRAAPLAYGLDGEMITEAIESDENSCAEWIEIRPAEFHMEPGSRQVVRVLTAIPKGTSGSKYANLTFTARPESGDGDSNALHDQGESGAILFLTVGKLTVKLGELQPPRIFMVGGPIGFVFETAFTNLGNTHVGLQATVSIKKRVMPPSVEGVEYIGSGSLLEMFSAPVSTPEGYVLPGGMRVLTASYPGVLEPGDYVVEFAVDYGGPSVAHIAKEFSVV
jgi:hypothetical protein